MKDFVKSQLFEIFEKGEPVTYGVLTSGRWYLINGEGILKTYFEFELSGKVRLVSEDSEVDFDWVLAEDGTLDLYKILKLFSFKVKSLNGNIIGMLPDDLLAGLVLFSEEKAKEFLIPLLN